MEKEMSHNPSRWWYALVPFPVLVGIRYALLWLTSVLLPTAGPSRFEALPALLSGLGASLVGALVVATAPLFLAGLVLDIRALRARASWRPHWGYGTLGVVPIVGVFIEWVALLSIPTAIGYLELRRRKVGQRSGYEAADMDPETASVESSAQAPRSRWLYGVILPPVLELTGVSVFWTVRTFGILRQGSDPLTLLVPIALVLVAIGFVPLFAISLYRDAKTVRDTSSTAIPYPHVWGFLGIGSLVGLVLFRITFTPLVALAYLLRRRQATAQSTLR